MIWIPFQWPLDGDSTHQRIVRVSSPNCRPRLAFDLGNFSWGSFFSLQFWPLLQFSAFLCAARWKRPKLPLQYRAERLRNFLVLREFRHFSDVVWKPREFIKPSVPANLTYLGSWLPNLTISDLQAHIVRHRVKIRGGLGMGFFGGSLFTENKSIDLSERSFFSMGISKFMPITHWIYLFAMFIRETNVRVTKLKFGFLLFWRYQEVRILTLCRAMRPWRSKVVKFDNLEPRGW